MAAPKPELFVAIVCGALHIADTELRKKRNAYLST